MALDTMRRAVKDSDQRAPLVAWWVRARSAARADRLYGSGVIVAVGNGVYGNGTACEPRRASRQTMRSPRSASSRRATIRLHHRLRFGRLLSVDALSLDPVRYDELWCSGAHQTDLLGTEGEAVWATFRRRRADIRANGVERALVRPDPSVTCGRQRSRLVRPASIPVKLFAAAPTIACWVERGETNAR